jgi:hypothetical protein
MRNKPVRYVSVPTAFNDEAQKQLEIAFRNLLDRYNSVANEKPDLLEQHRRGEAIRVLRKEHEQTYYLKDQLSEEPNQIIVSMLPRYLEYVSGRYKDNTLRIAEWYHDDWAVYLDQLRLDNPKLQDCSRKASKWSIKRVSSHIIAQLAFRKLEQAHNGIATSLNNLPYPKGTVKAEPESRDARDDNSQPYELASTDQQYKTQRHSTDDVISVEKKTIAAMLLEIMIHVGFTLDETNKRRLARLMSYLQSNMDESNINTNQQAISNVANDIQDNNRNLHRNNLIKLKQFLQHFVTKGGNKDSFIAHIEREILDRQE